MEKLNIILIIVDSCSYKYSWLNSKEYMPLLYSRKKEFKNYNSHYSAGNNTRLNIHTILTGMPPSLHKVLSKVHPFRGNNSLFLQKLLNDNNYKTCFYSTHKILREKSNDNVKDDLDFSDIEFMSPSLAESYVPGMNFNKIVKNKITNLGRDPFFMVLHYLDIHEPFQVPGLRLTHKETPKIINFTKEHILKNDLLWPLKSLINKYLPQIKKQNRIIYEEYQYLKNNVYRPLIFPERINGFYERLWNDTDFFKEYMFLFKQASMYQDKVLNDILNYIREIKNKNTIIMITADHGSNAIVSPNEKIKYGPILRDNKLLHIPLSIVCFDDHIKNKYNISGEISVPTSHVDIFNTITNVTNTSSMESNYLMNLLAPVEKKRYILAEQNSSTFAFGQIRMFDSVSNININVEASDNISELCPQNLIINDVSEEDYKKYFQYKTKLNQYYEELKWV